MRDDSFKISRSNHPPLIDAVLETGDAIYLPTFCPHEGLTIEDSVAIAFAWKGIAVFEILASLKDLITEDEARIIDENLGVFFQVLPDHPIKAKALETMVDVCDESFDLLGKDSPSRSEIEHLLGRLLYRDEP